MRSAIGKSAFKRILKGAYAINGIAGEPEDWQRFVDAEVKGGHAQTAFSSTCPSAEKTRSASKLTRCHLRVWL